MPIGYSRERTSVHNLNHHFVWCPKYRKPVLTDEVADSLERLIEAKADELGLDILRLAIQPDHVHLFPTGNPKLSPNKIIQQVNGYTSRNLRDEFDFSLPSLWTRSYFVSSAGEVSSQTIEEYIEAQTGR
ncbi:IS200/IS605 family transposase [Halobacteria archaeon AArc-m2/3/4]|uniref:IS200/IS605 family transposase n=1 Tax=Natronoglomus mannanivorans TaxID=2979990 RepID=A0AAP2Z054_9EURY|nr:IS200/IS605 family transposase [Halobacteria archaeon AArc-xg1-1]MCU4975344.1 IS200/IS605 family transposase [Halobacteria archaeon AArc-m2/3/4]